MSQAPDLAARNIFEHIVAPHFEQGDRKDYLDVARNVAIQISDKIGWVTVDQVRSVCPPPQDIDPRIMGAIFVPRKNWVHERGINSSRRTCHGRPIGVWKYVGPQKEVA